MVCLHRKEQAFYPSFHLALCAWIRVSSAPSIALGTKVVHVFIFRRWRRNKLWCLSHISFLLSSLNKQPHHFCFRKFLLVKCLAVPLWRCTGTRSERTKVIGLPLQVRSFVTVWYKCLAFDEKLGMSLNSKPSHHHAPVSAGLPYLMRNAHM